MRGSLINSYQFESKFNMNLSLQRKKYISHYITTLVYCDQKLPYVVGNGWDIGVLSFQMLLVHFAYSLHTLVYRLVIGISPSFRFLTWLHKQNCVAHGA